MTISCSNCGQEWPRDPALEVACPTCLAKVGQKCRRPSEHECEIHAGRDRLAMETVEGYGHCPAVQEAKRAELNELPLFAGIAQ